VSPAPQAPRLLALIAGWLAMALLLAASPKKWSWPARLAGPAAFGVLSAYPAGSLGFAANTEIFVAVFMTAAAFALRRSSSGLRGVSAGRENRDETMIVLWLGTALAGLMTGFLFFPHYFLQALPPLALACGLGIERVLRLRKSWGPALLIGLSLYPASVFAS